VSVRRLAPAEQQPASFAFTAENLAWAKQQVAKNPEGRQASAVIPLLWRAQEQAGGWTPRKAIEYVADMLGMAPIRVLEVATFYTMFLLQPVGRKAHVQWCGTTPCLLRGGEELKKVCQHRIHHEPFHVSADGDFSWEEVECLGACVNAPMVLIGKDTYEDLTSESFENVLDALARGETPTPGPQNGRQFSAPLGGETTLKETAALVAPRSEPEAPRVAAHAAPAPAVAPSMAALAPVTDAVPANTPAAVVSPLPVKDEATKTVPASSAVSSDAEAAVPKPNPAAGGEGATTARRMSASGMPKGEAAPKTVDASAPAAGVDPGSKNLPVPAEDRAVVPVDLPVTSEETDFTAKLAALPADATAEDRANAVGARPRGLTAARAGAPDNLRRIKGIGRVNEQKLNDLGIFHFDQIAQWTRAEIRWVGMYLAFPGRIDREKWVEQAASFARDRGSPSEPPKV
jgi:NADH-quinone oxidoreductase subunit E